MDIKNIDFNKLCISNFNVRKTLISDEDIDDDQTGIYDLSEDIRVNGLINPLTVRYNTETDKYEIIAGQRRYMALNLLTYKEVPCNILNIDDQKAEEISLVENVQRNNMTIFDKVKSYKKLYDTYNKDISRVISVIHISKSTLKRYLQISKLDDSIISRLDLKNDDNKISLDVAVALTKIPDDVDISEVLNIIKPLKNDQKINTIKTFINNGNDITELKDIAEDVVIQSNNIKLAPSYPYVIESGTNKHVKIPSFLFSSIISLIKEKTGNLEYV